MMGVIWGGTQRRRLFAPRWWDARYWFSRRFYYSGETEKHAYRELNQRFVFNTSMHEIVKQRKLELFVITLGRKLAEHARALVQAFTRIQVSSVRAAEALASAMQRAFNVSREATPPSSQVPANTSACISSTTKPGLPTEETRTPGGAPAQQNNMRSPAALPTTRGRTAEMDILLGGETKREES